MSEYTEMLYVDDKIVTTLKARYNYNEYLI
jgi:hypothetical protein